MSQTKAAAYSGPPLKLVYFNIAGKAECIRLALAYAGLPFEDTRVTFEQFDAMKASGDLAFGQVPCLLVGEKALVQTAAILRYVGKIAADFVQHPLYPSEPEAAALVDAIVDQDTDMMLGYVASQYATRFGFGDVVQRDSTAPPEKRARFGLVRQKLHDEVLPRHLSALAALLAKSPSGWLAGGDGPTIADFMIVPTLQRLRGRADGPPLGLGDGLSAGLVDRHPSLVSLVDRLMALPQVQAWCAARGQNVTYWHMPRMGFGTFNNWSGDWKSNEDTSLLTAVNAALDAGYRHFDCAELYYNEGTIGAALEAAQVAGKVTRADLFLVSKAWNHHRTPAALRKAVEGTLKALRTDYLDLYLIHWPVCWVEDSLGDMVVTGSGDVQIPAGKTDPRGEQEALAEAWRGMEALVDAGLVRQIGVSNYGVKRLKQLLETCRIHPACNQVECHPHFAQRELREFCREKSIDLVAYHPIGKPNHRKPGEPVAIEEPSVKRIAERLGCTPCQVLLAWHLHHGVVVIPKSCTPSRIVENFGALKVELSSEDVAAIDAMDKGLRFCDPSWMPSWD